MSGKPMPCRLLIDPPAEGAWNMAVDEVLLDDVASSGQPVLRFYQWSRPTLSLGYFQRAAERALHKPSLEADLVRRLSGGGAILHDRELTYSLILPNSHDLAGDTQQLYNAVHQTIVAQLRHMIDGGNGQWQPTLCKPTKSAASQDEPFLCFQRRTDGDILLASQQLADKSPDHKVVGSAQRRRRGTVLQHGSILLATSDFSPELSGIVDLTQSSLSASDLLNILPETIAAAAQLELQQTTLGAEQTDSAGHLMHAKYQSDSWTRRR